MLAFMCTGSILCLNGGTCSGYGYCYCPYGYSGQICETSQFRLEAVVVVVLSSCGDATSFLIRAAGVWFVQRNNLLQQWNMHKWYVCLSILVHWIRLLNGDL